MRVRVTSQDGETQPLVRKVGKNMILIEDQTISLAVAVKPRELVAFGETLPVLFPEEKRAAHACLTKRFESLWFSSKG